MNPETTSSNNKQDQNRPRWELLLLLLVLLVNLCCIFNSTEIARDFWPRQVLASLLSGRQADYTGGPDELRFAVFDPQINSEAATDIARLQRTPSGDEVGEAVVSLPLPSPHPPTPAPRPTPRSRPPAGLTPLPPATVNSTPTAAAVSSPTAGPTVHLTAPPSSTPAKTALPALPPATRSSPLPPPPADTPPPDDDDDDDDDDGGNPRPTATAGPGPVFTPTSTPTNTPTVTPTNTPTAVLISGRVFEDTGYSGGPGTAFGGGDAGLPNVEVELYDGPVLLAATTTTSTGDYAFSGAPSSGTVTVRVVSVTIGDVDTLTAARFNSGFARALPEQTYESNGTTGNGGTGALGGNDPDLADPSQAAGTGPGDTNTTVTVSGADVTGVDFGFAFNLAATTAAVGQGSLQQAIDNANALAGTDRIVFNIAGSPPYTIRPNPALREITDPVVIDGTTQPGFVAAPLIELAGGGSGGTGTGLKISAGDSTVRGLVINRFGTGLELVGGGNNVIAGNYFGLDPTGGTAVGNAVNIDVNGSANNRIGGATAADQNVAAGGASFEIRLRAGADANTIQGNYIGLNAAGTVGLGLGTGVAIYDSAANRIGGPAAGEGNVISTGGNVGLYLTGSGGGNIIQGNTIGTDATGTAALGNLRGIHINGGAPNTTIGGTVAGAGNLIAHSSLEGVSLGDFSSSQGITIRENSIYANGGLGIDLGVDGPTGNDPGDGDTGPNDLFNFPVFESVTLNGGNLTVSGFARPDSIIEFFIADPDPTGLGEGRTYLNTLIEGAGGVDLDAGSNSYTNPLGGNDTTNRFRFIFPAGSVALGDQLTATATNPAGDTSEFGPNAVVSLPLTVQISGRVFEDVDYSGGGGTAFGGGDAGLPNVTVELYDSPILLDSVVTDAAGNYTFPTAPANRTLTVRAVSATIGDADTLPAAGFNSGSDTALAEQTYESDGVAGNGGAGALGGNDPLLDDPATAAGAGPGDTNVTVTTAGSDVTGVDLGFAFNLVANTNDARQGSLREAISNANAIAGTDALVFNIAGGAPHTISLNSALPVIIDPVIIDGTTQPGFIADPVIELNGAGAGSGSHGLRLLAADSTIRGLVINRFDNSGISMQTATNNLIAGNFIGTDTAGATALPNGGHGIYIFTTCPAGGAIIGGAAPADGNLISGNDYDGINIASCDGNIIQGNTIGTDITGLARLPNRRGISLEFSSNNLIGGTTPGAGNLVSANLEEGLFLGGLLASNNVVQNNRLGVNAGGAAILGNGRHGLALDRVTDTVIGPGNEISGNDQNGLMIISSDRNLVLSNTIHANFDDGLHIESGVENRIQTNSIYGNGGLGINLLSSPATFWGETSNDPGDSDTGPNNLFNFPVIDQATISGGNLTVTGYARPNSIIEFFIAFTDPSDFGEGQTYLATFVEDSLNDLDGGSGSYGPGKAGQDTTNRFEFVFPAGSLMVGDQITATATDPAGNTSEFSFVFMIN